MHEWNRLLGCLIDSTVSLCVFVWCLVGWLRVAWSRTIIVLCWCLLVGSIDCDCMFLRTTVDITRCVCVDIVVQHIICLHIFLLNHYY